MLSSLEALDHAIFDWVATFHAPWLDLVMLAATHAGAKAFLWLVVAAIAFVFPARRAGAWRTFLAIGLTALIVDGITKPLVWRDRPYVALAAEGDVRVVDAKPASSSFPSGHAANAAAGATALSLLFPSAQLLWWALAATVAVSRVYVGVHFPLDVLAGLTLGFLCARFVLGGIQPQHAPFALTPSRPDQA
jgi:undecaprenyl-diphosphatase